jgi:hypothetical protein
MNRRVGIVATAVVGALLIAGVAQAARPVSGTPAGQAFVAFTDPNNVQTIPQTGTPTQELEELALPSDGKFLVTATLLVGNRSTANEAFVNCNLFYGPALTVGTWLDWAVTLLPVSDGTGSGENKLTLTGYVIRTAAPATDVLRVICFANGDSFAQYVHISAVSVSAITGQ